MMARWREVEIVLDEYGDDVREAYAAWRRTRGEARRLRREASGYHPRDTMALRLHDRAYWLERDAEVLRERCASMMRAIDRGRRERRKLFPPRATAPHTTQDP